MTQLEIEIEANKTLRKINKELIEALEGILDIGKRNTENLESEKFADSKARRLTSHWAGLEEGNRIGSAQFKKQLKKTVKKFRGL